MNFIFFKTEVHLTRNRQPFILVASPPHQIVNLLAAAGCVQKLHESALKSSTLCLQNYRNLSLLKLWTLITRASIGHQYICKMWTS